MNNLNIGWIGLGTMGIPMANSLLRAGFDLTTYNRTQGKDLMLEGQSNVSVSSPAELISTVDIVIVMVTDDQAINDIFEGGDGLFSATITGKIIINMSTVSPAISIKMAALCHDQGNKYLDAPVSGSVKQATESTLVIIVGGDEDLFVQVKPILETMGKLVIRFGGVGSGNNVKLIVNTFLAIQAQALAEALAFAEKLDVDKAELMNVLNNGALGSPFVKIKGEAILSDNYKPAFTLNNIVKDLRLAKDIGLNFPLGLTALSSYESAAPEYGSLDIIGVVKAIRADN